MNVRTLTRHTLVIAVTALVALSGCSSTSKSSTTVGPLKVGPGAYIPQGSVKKEYTYHSDIFLDVAIPVFDPGFPKDENGNIDDAKVLEQNIWPQIRRTEAKRFAVETKKALAKTASFGRVNVTPTTNTSADLFVLGKIIRSDVKHLELEVTVIDGRGKFWGKKTFENEVSKGFYRDQARKDQNPHANLYVEIADYVHGMLVKKSEAEKTRIQTVSDILYANTYSPETFSEYIVVDENYRSNGGYQQSDVVALPDPNNPMLKRIEALKAQDEMFVDNLQDNFDLFSANTHDAYRTYQRETLPIIEKIEREKTKRTVSQVATFGLAVASILLSKNSRSTAGQVGSAIAGVAAAKTLIDAVQSNDEIAKHRGLFTEMGENLDVEVSPQVLEFNEQEIELTGTAGEQYEQWKAHLFEIYELEATPDTQL